MDSGIEIITTRVNQSQRLVLQFLQFLTATSRKVQELINPSHLGRDATKIGQQLILLYMNCYSPLLPRCTQAIDSGDLTLPTVGITGRDLSLCAL